MQNTNTNLENKSPNIAQYARSVLMQDGSALSKVVNTMNLQDQYSELEALGWFFNTASESQTPIPPALAKVAAITLLQGVSLDGSSKDTLRVFLALEFFYRALPNSIQPSFSLFARDMLREVYKEPELSERTNSIKKILSEHVDYLIDSDRIEVLEGVIDLPHMTHADSKNFIDILIFKGELNNITPKMQVMITKLVSKLKKPEEMELIEAARRDNIEGLAIAIVDHRSKTISFVDDTVDQAIFIMNTALKSQHPETKSRILDAINAAYNKAPFSTFQYDHNLLLATIRFSNSVNATNMPFFNAWDKFELADELVALYNDRTLSDDDKAHVKRFYNSYIATYHSTKLAHDMSGFVKDMMNNGVDVYAEEEDIHRYEAKTSKILNILDFDSVNQLKHSDPDMSISSIMVKFFVKAGDAIVSDPSKTQFIKSFMKSLDSMREHKSLETVEVSNEKAPEKAPSLLSKIFSKITGSPEVESRER